MSMIESGSLYYANRPLKIPSGAASVQGLGARTTGSPKIDKGSELWKSCQDFEAIFVKMMLKEMKKTVEKSGLVSGGSAEEIFEDMLYDEYSADMAKTSNFGLSEQLYTQLSSGR